MPEAFTNLIYCALLSSRSTGNCTSPQSAVKIVVAGMRDKRRLDASNVENHVAALRQCRREARSEQIRPLFTVGDILLRKPNVKSFRKAAKRPSELLRQHRMHPFCNKPHLSQSPLLRLANPRGLPIHYSVASVHSSALVHDIRLAAQDPLAYQKKCALDPFRSCMTRHPFGPQDLQEAWDEFDALWTSGALSNLSDDEVMAFTTRAYEASLLSFHESGTPTKKFIARLGRLHDEFEHRLENSPGLPNPALRTWSSSLAVQTFIHAGKLERAMQTVTESFVFSKGQVEPLQITSLQQLFLASTLQHSLEEGIDVLARSWFWIRAHFNVHQSGQVDEMQTAAKALRQSIVHALGTVEEGSTFLQGIKDNTVQGVGASIFAFVYGTQESADKVQAVYHEFIRRGLSMPLEAHLRFFAAFLSKGAYTQAYAVRKQIRSQFLTKEAERELSAVLGLFPHLLTPDRPERDALSLKVESAVKARFLSCIEGRLPPRVELLMVWEEMETSGILSRRGSNGAMILHDSNLFAFARAIVDRSRATLDGQEIPDSRKLARIIDLTLEELARRRSRRRGAQIAEAPFTKPLIWHSLTLKEDLHSVGDMLIIDRSLQNSPEYIRAVNQLFLAALRLQSLRGAFQHLVPLWRVVIQHLDDVGTRYKGRMEQASADLRNNVFTVFSAIEDPVEWIASVSGAQAQTIAAEFFFILFRDRGESDRAWQAFNDLAASRVSISFEAHLILIKTFLRAHAYEAANYVYQSLHTQFPDRTSAPELRNKDQLHTGLRLFSLQGDTIQAEECFAAMDACGLVDGGARRQLLHSYAAVGNTERVRELFHQFFPPGDHVMPRPGAQDFREVIYAHVRAGDLEGINHWLDKMAITGIRPDLSIYNMILLAFATSSDLESATAVLVRMYENDVKPDRISYTTVISTMAERKDPVAAEQLYKRALDEGVEPDDVMTMALMNAHVEAGSWRGVIRAFDYLQQSRRRSIRHSTQLYNTLMKAYVLIGAPFRVVSDLFRRFESLGLEPTEYTYALVIQSACDSRRMDIACDLFLQLDAMQGHGKSHVNAYIMTIIMAGFLRNGNKRKAKGVYDDMQARGIQPTSVTFGVIIQSYANERSEESLRIAENFMHTLLAAEESQRAWIGSARGGRSKALQSVFGPLMSIYGRELDVAAVERQFDEMLAAGGQPTLVALTMLMDAYRRVHNLEGAQQIWSEVTEVALRTSHSDVFERLPAPAHPPRTTRGGPQRQANILCLPLSIYIDALSAAGQHVQIATTWRQVKDWGFTFDAHNWNHLAVALVCAGEVERAFEIVERVLIPYQAQTRNFVRSRRKGPQTPLTFVGPADAVEGESENKTQEADEGQETPRSPARPPNRRMQAVGDATRRLDWLTPLDELDSDPAQPLHELQQISLTWQAWRTHSVTLDALSAAVKQLEAGMRVRPAGEAVREDKDPRRMSPEDADSFYARERQEMGEILQRIYQNYPNALERVQRREMELQRLRDTSTGRAYS